MQPEVLPSIVYQSTAEDEQWSVKQIFEDKDTFFLVATILLIVCILIVFFSVLSCCLITSKNQFGKYVKALEERQDILNGQNTEIKNIIYNELETISNARSEAYRTEYQRDDRSMLSRYTQ